MPETIHPVVEMARPHSDKPLQGRKLDQVGTAGFEPATP
jgi:hypothetical protein